MAQHILDPLRELSGNDQTETSLRLNIGRASERQDEDSSTSLTSRTGYEDSGLDLPDKKITLFALRLAILEKGASVLGTLGFIWATVVLLGGFAITLEKPDFWFVTIILVIESTRIFSRSHELEWQHETTLSAADFKSDAKWVGCRAFYSLFNGILRPNSASEKSEGEEKADGKLQRRWSFSNVQLVPYTGWLSVSKNVSRLLFWSQLVSALTCVALSVYRLAGQEYGAVSGSDRKNRRSALNIFYGLSLAEALLFLLEKAYWQWKINAGKLLVEVNEEYGFDSREVGTVRRFFYDAYSRCVNGSVFDVFKMDFVSFSVELLKSNAGHGQLTGARILSAFVKDPRFEQATLRAIAGREDVVQRLVEMLNWTNHQEQEIRKAAAEIISRFIRENRNSIRVARIPGALESIASLLHDGKRDFEMYDYLGFSLLGLHILNKLAEHPVNSAKIGSAKNLLPRIIEFTEINTNESNTRISEVKLSLQLLKMLARSKGVAGEVLRKQILKNVFTTSNLRDVLLYRGFDHVRLQILAIETLSSLATEEEGRESIGSTGGVLGNLFSVFFMDSINSNGDGEERKKAVSKAGEALTLLALENTHNCESMFRVKLLQQCGECEQVITALLAALADSLRGVHAAKILGNMCAYAGTDDLNAQLMQLAAAAPQVLKLVMEEEVEAGPFEEAAVGLAAQIFKLLQKSDMDDNSVFQEAGITKELFMMRLIEVLARHCRPSMRAPNIRRFCIELVIYLLEKEKVGCFGMERAELEDAVQRVMETTSEMENYATYSGSIGLTKHRITINMLLHTAMELLVLRLPA